MRAYNESALEFGRNYIIPKPIDPRLIETVSPAVAKAAIDSGVAKRVIEDWDAYKLELRNRLGLDNKFIRRMMTQARQHPKQVVFAEADNIKILKAAQIVKEEGIAIPVLLGNVTKIKEMLEENGIDLGNVTIIDPLMEDAKREAYGAKFFAERQRKGINIYESVKLMRDRNYYGCMMVNEGECDAFISGLTKNYPKSLKPAMQIIGRETGISKVAGMYIIMTKKGPFFFADTTVNIDPTEAELVEITKMTHAEVLKLGVKPNIAMLSYSNFGSAKGEVPEKVSNAVSYLHKNHPEIVVDGDIQANFAMNNDMLKENFPFSRLVDKEVNTFIFPNLAAGNIAYKFAQSFAGAESMGPVLLGFNKSVHFLQLGSSVREIVNMVAVAVLDAESKK
jgi:malate dehydrogenase (oxaloacetate-decarboxylating)(NADP+)